MTVLKITLLSALITLAGLGCTATPIPLPLLDGGSGPPYGDAGVIPPSPADVGSLPDAMGGLYDAPSAPDVFGPFWTQEAGADASALDLGLTADAATDSLADDTGADDDTGPLQLDSGADSSEDNGVLTLDAESAD